MRAASSDWLGGRRPAADQGLRLTIGNDCWLGATTPPISQVRLGFFNGEPEIADIGVGVSVVDLGTVPDPVPGPSTWMLVSAALGGLILSRRRSHCGPA